MFSYRSCWLYALSFCSEKNYIKKLEIRNGIMLLCEVSPEVFWKKFNDFTLSIYRYRKICSNIKKYLLYNLPIPYLTKKVYFRGQIFEVEKGVFIPQSDTELLVETVLDLSKQFFSFEYEVKILEMGTGCGNIAISLALNKPHWKIVATDINPLAKKVAKKNSDRHKTNIDFLISDIFSGLKEKEIFDIIIFNPPYLSTKEYDHLPSIVKKQPYNALVAEDDGLFFYTKVMNQYSTFVSEKAFLVMEISASIKLKLEKLLISLSLDDSKIISDYNGKPRVLVVNLNKIKRLLIT